MQKYVCTVCNYIYDPVLGDPEHGIPAGTAFADIPDSWSCPLCGVDKSQFQPVEEPKPATPVAAKPVADNSRAWSAKFIESIDRTSSITSFRFEPLTPLDFLPGQFVQVVFDKQNPQNAKLNKILSMSTPPGEKFFELTKRRSESEFSRKLWSLKPGDTIEMLGPNGECVFNRGLQKIAFLTGGIGVTPVTSILGYITQNALNSDAVLIYSNRTQNDIAYRDLLDGYAQKQPNLKIVYTVDYEKPTDSRISFGMINKDFVLKNIPDYRERTFFIFGPPGMVTAMAKLCQELGCPPERIKAENFAGY